MAAIIQPHRLPQVSAPRPELRLVHGGRSAHPAWDRPTSPMVPAVLGLLLVLLVMAGAVAVGSGALASLAPAPPAASAGAARASAGASSVLVRPGDTMWSIARRIQPHGDVRALVDQLVAANGSSSLQAGDRVVVPQS